MSFIGLYPGTFDPITKGHTDIIARAAQIVEHLVIGVATSPNKQPLFSLEERVAMVEHDIALIRQQNPKVSIEVRPFDSLLLHFAQTIQARVIVRGLRAVSDFEYEFQMAGMNMRMNSSIETIFLMSSDRHQFISSSLVKEVGRLNGDVSQFVSENTANCLHKCFRR